jgi:hypothetical protein
MQAVVEQLIRSDAESMEILRAVETLNLPDWAIGAGFVRSLVWDHLHGYETRTPLTDIDVLYFDPNDTSEAIEKNIDARLQALLPDKPWSAKNQARMHVISSSPPFTDTIDGMRNWLETPTAVAVRLERNDLIFLAPFGFDDLLDLVIRPTPAGVRRIDAYRHRVLSKPWLRQWPKVRAMGLDIELVGSTSRPAKTGDHA